MAIMVKNFNKIIMSYIAFISSIVVGFLALILPPKGIIDNSVLWFIAQLLLFTSSIIGVNFQINKNIV